MTMIDHDHAFVSAFASCIKLHTAAKLLDRVQSCVVRGQAQKYKT